MTIFMFSLGKGSEKLKGWLSCGEAGLPGKEGVDVWFEEVFFAVYSVASVKDGLPADSGSMSQTEKSRWLKAGPVLGLLECMDGGAAACCGLFGRTGFLEQQTRRGWVISLGHGLHNVTWLVVGVTAAGYGERNIGLVRPIHLTTGPGD